jgi:hypothetical protein
MRKVDRKPEDTPNITKFTYMRNMKRLNCLNALSLLAIAGSGCIVLSGCSQKAATDAPASPGASISPVASGSSTSPSTPPPKSVVTNSEQLGADPIQFLQSDQVKAELKLTNDQITKIKEAQSDLQTRLTKEFDTIKALPKEKQADEIEKKIEPLNEESRGKMDKIFLPEQAKRAKELILQNYGFGVMTKNDFSTELKVTDAQKKQFNTINEQMVAKLKSTVEIPTGDPITQSKMVSDNRKRMANIVKESDKQINAALTPEQKQALEGLKGKPFNYIQPTPSAPAK